MEISNRRNSQDKWKVNAFDEKESQKEQVEITGFYYNLFLELLDFFNLYINHFDKIIF